MKPKLILIGGPPFVGKTTAAEHLFCRMENSAWLDGDDVWRVNPFRLDDPRLRTSDINMAFVVQTYLRSRFDYVILSSVVLDEPEITAGILDCISGVDYDLLHFSLICSEQILSQRAEKRQGVTSPDPRFLRQAIATDTIKIDTSKKHPPEVAESIFKQVVAHEGQ